MRFTFGLTLLLGLLAAVGPVSTDIYLPAFSIIDHEFGRVGVAQFTLAAWFAGLAVGQMVQGPLSDRWGRRAPLLYGTLIYAAASAGCALSHTLPWFCAFRVLAAFGGSASMVVPRAMIRDVSHGIAAARALSRLTLVMGVVPILAPGLGSILLVAFSWRDLFWAAGVYGVLCTVLVWRFLPDTLPTERRLRQGVEAIARRYVMIGRDRLFVGSVLMAGCGFASMFAYIGGSASVYTGFFGLSPPQYGLLFGCNAAGFIAGAQASPHLAARYGIDRVMRVAGRTVFAAFGLAAAIAVAQGGLVTLLAPVFVAQTMLGVMSPLCTVGALTRHRSHAGSASALMGTAQFTLGAFGGLLVGVLNDGGPQPVFLLAAGLALVIVLADWRRPSIAAAEVEAG